uniref:Uncharacterized protein n=1 Tax=Panagrolaimus superbus TaxID=310955 RepID=A0A914ZGQ6_9BILA
MNCCCFKNLFAAFLLLNSANFQENASNNVQQLFDIHEKSVNELSSDDVGVQQGNDVKLTKEGSINLTLTFNKLEFEVCDCSKGSQICYESVNNWDGAVGSCFKYPSFCEFKVMDDKETDSLVFGQTTHVFKSLITGCPRSEMKYDYAEIKTKVLFYIKSCDPKINPADKMIKLQVIHLSLCPIIVKNAIIHLQEIASTKPPSLSQNPNDSSSTASFPWWGILIIVFAFVIAGIGIAFVV